MLRCASPGRGEETNFSLVFPKLALPWASCRRGCRTLSYSEQALYGCVLKKTTPGSPHPAQGRRAPSRAVPDPATSTRAFIPQRPTTVRTSICSYLPPPGARPLPRCAPMRFCRFELATGQGELEPALCKSLHVSCFGAIF